MRNGTIKEKTGRELY